MKRHQHIIYLIIFMGKLLTVMDGRVLCLIQGDFVTTLSTLSENISSVSQIGHVMSRGFWGERSLFLTNKVKICFIYLYFVRVCSVSK